MTPQAFRQKVRDIIADGLPGVEPQFTNTQLDSWRDDEVGTLYAKGFSVRATTRGTVETTIAEAAGVVARYYALPDTFRRVHWVEFVDATTDAVVGETSYVDDQEEPGQVRVDEAYKYVGYKLRMHGEREYTGVEDARMKTELTEVLKYGVALQALAHEQMKRLKGARSQVATRTQDATPGAIAAAIQSVYVLFRQKLADAIDVQAIQAAQR